jgi:hypothetical protein
MLKPTLACITLATVLAGFPASAQQSPPPTTQPEATLVGLPVYSSDGQKLGEVTSASGIGGRPALRAEMGAFLASALASFSSMPRCSRRRLTASNSL